MDFNPDTYQPMPVGYQLRYSILEKIRDGEDPLPDIDGREETKKDVVRAILSNSYPYLVSREGTGKTRLAESLAKLLPSVPKIKGCPYNDDPKWPEDWLCPRCADSEDPIDEFGVDFIHGTMRYSRIQGNEYTNEAKILGLKDIQAIAQGQSPTDPKVFMGTGVLRGNRGILFVDELPAIPTKVQVLFHPILEEKKVILEEYNWVRPIDVYFVATGNPEGFSHVNRIPEPLLDRLELVPMDMPRGDVLKVIVSKEKFEINIDNYAAIKPDSKYPIFRPDISLLGVKASLPWWVGDIVRTTVEYTNNCRNIDKGASIRGPIKAINHTYSSVEIKGRRVASLKDGLLGLKLSMRGRIKIRPELIVSRGKAIEAFKKIDEIVEDVMWYATKKIVENINNEIGFNEEEFKEELKTVLISAEQPTTDKLSGYPVLKKVMNQIKDLAAEKAPKNLNEYEKEIYLHPENLNENILEEYDYSTFEIATNLGIHLDLINESMAINKVFVPKRFKHD